MLSRLREGAIRIASTRIGRLLFAASGVIYGRDLRLYGIPIVQKGAAAQIKIGTRVTLVSDSRYTDLGVSRPCILRAGPGATIIIGDHVGMSGVTLNSRTSIVIGSHTLIGADVMIVDSDFHPISAENRRYSKMGVLSQPVEIGSNVFVGARSIILKGVRIGDNSVIGAGSVVVKDVPENCIVAGNPARLIGTLP